MDLSKARTSDTAKLEVVHPKEGKTDIIIELAGRDSELYQKESAKHRKNTVSKELDEGKAERLLSEFLAKITVSWENIDYEDKELECTFANAFMLYKDRQLSWLREQVYMFVTNRGNYLGN